MFNKLFSNVSGLNSFTSIISWVQNLITHVISDTKDENAKDATIDAIIEILQEAKTKKPIL